jgi:hypothetical protein
MFPFLQSRDHPSYLHSDSTAWRLTASGRGQQPSPCQGIHVTQCTGGGSAVCRGLARQVAAADRDRAGAGGVVMPRPLIGQLSESPSDRTLILRDPLPQPPTA